MHIEFPNNLNANLIQLLANLFPTSVKINNFVFNLIEKIKFCFFVTLLRCTLKSVISTEYNMLSSNLYNFLLGI